MLGRIPLTVLCRLVRISVGSVVCLLSTCNSAAFATGLAKEAAAKVKKVKRKVTMREYNML